VKAVNSKQYGYRAGKPVDKIVGINFSACDAWQRIPVGKDFRAIDAAHVPESQMSKPVPAVSVVVPCYNGARFIDQLVATLQGIEVVVLRLRRVPVLDATGVTALRAIHDRLKRRGIELILSGLQPQPAGVLKRTGVYDEITDHGRNDVVMTEHAIAEAKRRLLARV